MKNNTPPMQPETFYHIYNRGINGEIVFKEARNFDYFLHQYSKYIAPFAHTYAYCLLNNHFHFLIRIKEESEVLKHVNIKNLIDSTPAFIISNQFAKFFNSYTQTINNSYNRTGGLFEKPFRRAEVNSDDYLSTLIAYIHYNPQKHKLINDFRNYKYSSYFSLICENKPTKLCREEVWQWFGGKQAFLDFHDANIDVFLQGCDMALDEV